MAVRVYSTRHIHFKEEGTPMSEFTRASEERIHAFPFGELYLFKHYFEEQDLFDQLKRYYNSSEYRFEVPAEDYPSVEELLREYGYGLISIDNVQEFVVVVEKYTEHPDNVFKDSVYHEGGAGHNFFLMKDRVAVEQTVHNGAIHFPETDLEMPF
jgi:hypothetical protein